MGRYKRRAGIYTITSLINDKVYVGHSTSVMKRLANHRNRLRAGLHNNVHLQSAWNLYGEKNFVFNIVENLPSGLTKQEYEVVETKWVLKFNSHKNTYGYNNTLPGNIPLLREDENKSSIKRTYERIEYLCIEISTGNIKECCNSLEVGELVNIPVNKVGELSSYWEKLNDNSISYKGRKKSRNGWIIIKKKFYDPNFDYINYKKKRMYKDIVKKTWRDYYKKENHRKNPEDIIPYRERQIKRIPVIATNIETGEERKFPMIKSCFPEFDKIKVYKCINFPFRKYKHRGHYFRKAEIGG